MNMPTLVKSKLIASVLLLTLSSIHNLALAQQTSPTKPIKPSERKKKQISQEEANQQRALFQELAKIFASGGAAPVSDGHDMASTFLGGSGSRQNPLTTFNGKCGSVKVDCGSHRISMIPLSIDAGESLIDCGRMGLTKNCVGRVGGIHRGPVVKDGVDINCPGMGDANGGKVFHTRFWSNDPYPLGGNVSKGCVHVSPSVLTILKKCESSPLEIVNAEGGGANPSSSQQSIFNSGSSAIQ